MGGPGGSGQLVGDRPDWLGHRVSPPSALTTSSATWMVNQVAPTKRGFGSLLIERACTYQLNGSVELDYATEGLTCQIVFPLN